jgi:NCAIR mutase (PurE)-related protein
MDRDRAQRLLEQVRAGDVSIPDALEQMAHLPYQDLGFARLDGHRALRRRFAETVFCQGKTTEQVAEIFSHLAQHHDRVLGTRATQAQFEAVHERLPQARWHAMPRLITCGDEPVPRTTRRVVVATGGTADMPVAEEAVLVSRFMGVPTDALYDVGVAGVHRVLNNLDLLRAARVVIAVAGMEGALPTLLAGLLACPVIAVPTSVGYGAHFEGLAPLLTMLNSCATGIAVVNIDNGFGAAMLASMIALGDEANPT